MAKKRRCMERSSAVDRVQEAIESLHLQKQAIETHLSHAEAQIEVLRTECSQLAGERAALERLSDSELEELEAKVLAASSALTAEWRRRSKARAEQHLCVVCLDKPRSVVLQPCHHCIMCKQCLRRLLSNSNALCPQCRGAITSHIEIYH